MIVVCNGGYRTGSTLVYSICIALLDKAADDYIYGVYGHEEILTLSDDCNHILKSHNWLPPKDSSIKTIYTRRHHLDVYASFVKMKKIGQAIDIDVIANLVEEQRRREHMLRRDCLTLDYEDIFDNIEFTVRKIADFLGVDLSPMSIERVAVEFTRENLKPKTDVATGSGGIPWHPHHISDDPSPGNFIEVLDYETIVKVVSAMRHKNFNLKR